MIVTDTGERLQVDDLGRSIGRSRPVQRWRQGDREGEDAREPTDHSYESAEQALRRDVETSTRPQQRARHAYNARTHLRHISSAAEPRRNRMKGRQPPDASTRRKGTHGGFTPPVKSANVKCDGTWDVACSASDEASPKALLVYSKAVLGMRTTGEDGSERLGYVEVEE